MSAPDDPNSRRWPCRCQRSMEFSQLVSATFMVGERDGHPAAAVSRRYRCQKCGRVTETLERETGGHETQPTEGQA